MTRVQSADYRPVGRNCSQRAQYELALGEEWVRYGEAASSKSRPVPGGKVEIQYARPPALARAAAEASFERFEYIQHGSGLKRAFNEGYRVGEIASRAADWLVQNNR